MENARIPGDTGELSARGIDPVLIDTVARAGKYYSKDYLHELERHMPFHFSILHKQREKLEKQVFKRSLDDIWAETIKFFEERDPEQIVRANNNPKRKMALIFRWYLGLSSRWSNVGEVGREMDFQIWCGPAIGSFNEWTKGTYMAEPEKRRVVDVGLHLLKGAAYLYRVQQLKLQGVRFAPGVDQYVPESPLI